MKELHESPFTKKPPPGFCSASVICPNMGEDQTSNPTQAISNERNQHDMVNVTGEERDLIYAFCRAYATLRYMAISHGSREGNGHLWTTTYGELLFQYIPKVVNEDDPQPWGSHRVKTLEKFTSEGSGTEIALHLSGGAIQIFPVSEEVNAKKGGWGGGSACGEYAKMVASIVKRFYPHDDKNIILRDVTSQNALPTLFYQLEEYCTCGTTECGTYICNMTFAYKFLPPQRYAILIEGDVGRAITKVLRTLDEMLPAKVFELKWVDYSEVDRLVDKALDGAL